MLQVLDNSVAICGLKVAWLGCGLEPAIEAHLFQPLFRLSKIWAITAALLGHRDRLRLTRDLRMHLGSRSILRLNLHRSASFDCLASLNLPFLSLKLGFDTRVRR